MSEGATQAVKSLFVTLRRSYAGTPWFNRRVLEALGLKRRHQCVEKPNNASVRGMLAKVPHMVVIETDRMRYLRDLKAHHEQLPRAPWILHHDSALRASIATSAAGTLPAAAAAPSASGAALTQPLPPPPPPPRPTPFAVQHLKEHVFPSALAGYDVSAPPPQAPGRFLRERAQRWRVKMLTERGIFSSDAQAEHQDAIRPKVYRRRVGIRD